MDGVGDNGVSSGAPQRHLGLFTGTTGLGEVAGEGILVLKRKIKEGNNVRKKIDGGYCPVDIFTMFVDGNVIYLYQYHDEIVQILIIFLPLGPRYFLW
jgi:hypothetical protein